MSTEDRKCPKCGGAMEDGFLWTVNTVGEYHVTNFERCGWMAGGELQYEKVGVWPLKTSVTTNARRILTAPRCTSCGLVEFYAR